MQDQTLRVFWHIFSGLFFLSGCTPANESTLSESYVSEVQKWHSERISELKSDDGWLNLAGMFWLQAGENRFGSHPSNDLVFPQTKALPFIGSYFLEGEEVRVKIRSAIEILAEGQAVTAKTLPINHDENAKGALAYGSLKWFLIARDGQIGVRLRDFDSPAARQFQGVATFPIDPDWRIDATFTPHDPPKKLLAGTVLGTIREHTSPGTLSFVIDDQTHSLEVMNTNKHGQLFVVFGDQTNGSDTYGGGRFLYVDAPDESGRAVIDFNKSYNPPCAFSDFSTCPLPPKQNRLSLKITAGEKKYDHAAKAQS